MHSHSKGMLISKKENGTQRDPQTTGYGTKNLSFENSKVKNLEIPVKPGSKNNSFTIFEQNELVSFSQSKEVDSKKNGKDKFSKVNANKSNFYSRSSHGMEKNQAPADKKIKFRMSKHGIVVGDTSIKIGNLENYEIIPQSEAPHKDKEDIMESLRCFKVFDQAGEDQM